MDGSAYIIVLHSNYLLRSLLLAKWPGTLMTQTSTLQKAMCSDFVVCCLYLGRTQKSIFENLKILVTITYRF